MSKRPKKGKNVIMLYSILGREFNAHMKQWTVDSQERNTQRSGLEVIKLEYSLRLKIKCNDWLLANYCALF